MFACVYADKGLFFSVFAVIENGTDDFDEADIKTDSFQVRNLLQILFSFTLITTASGQLKTYQFAEFMYLFPTLCWV